MSRKRIVIISDLHCGHLFGLTPPAWWYSTEPKGNGFEKIKKFQRQLWEFFFFEIKKLKPVDFLIVNGDSIEGKGERTGGIELITSDRVEQVEMAFEVVKIINAKHIRILVGTPYHVGDTEHYEKILANKCSEICDDVKFDIRGFYEIEGIRFDVRHKIAGSQVPHGRYTAIARSRLWNVVWHSERERQPLADVYIRSHVHYFGFAGAASWLGITTPAMTYNSIYGKRDCEGLVDIGFLVFEVEDGQYNWWPVLARFKETKTKAEKIS